MKKKVLLVAVTLAVIANTGLFSHAYAQGSLTPPGAPAPTMKTLSQVEPRIAITNTSSLVTISQPGSYYLTGNLTVSFGDAIDITTNGVTLDLNGFTISCFTSGGGDAIFMAGGNNDVTIFNGHIRGGVTNNAGTYSGFGFNTGIVAFGNACYNLRVSGVSVSGCQTVGIFLSTGNSSMVESCTVKTVGTYGIEADIVNHCTTHECGAYGIYATTVSDSRGEATGTFSLPGIGIFATTANNCYGSSSGTSVNSYGLDVSSIAIGCHGACASGVGISAYIANSCRVFSGTTNISFKYNMP